MAGTNNSSVRSYNFFLDGTIQGGGTYAENGHAFVDAASGTIFLSHTIVLVNDGGADIFFSFDGVNDHGRVKSGESLTQDYRRTRKISLRGTAANAFRFWAY